MTTSSSPTLGVPTIGVFDSGFGGLTVLRALLARMPAARYVFLGDTARLPYGSKSRRTIARYAAESARFLVHEQGAEFLVIACNTASALALDAIQESVPIPVLGVIQPGASAARAVSQTGHVLVLATDATVQSHAYSAACHALGLRTLEKACPLLVPLVEEGWTTDWLLPSNSPSADSASTATNATPAPPQVAVTEQVIRIYLDEILATAAAENLQPDTLVLGCTHYPLLRPLIEKAVPAGMAVIDSAQAAADAAVTLFNGRLAPPAAAPPAAAPPAAAPPPSANAETAGQPSIRCFATDSVEKFSRLGSRFLGHPVGDVQLIDLGG